MAVRPLTPALAEKARAELNEDPRTLKDDLQHLKDWLGKQHHLNICTDDQWLVTFLRGCKFSLERTKEKLDSYYSVRSTAPEMFNVKYNDPKFNEMLETGLFLYLPKTAAPDSPRVFIYRYGAAAPNKFNIMDQMCVVNTLQRIAFFDDDNAVVSGVQTIVDLEGATLAHYLQMTPITIKKMVVVGQDASPIRMKGVHYLNTPNGFETVYNMFKNLLNEKNRSRLYVHNKNYEEMYKYIPKHILPAEYGGESGTIAEIIEYWKKKVEKYASWLEEDFKHGSNESKRPGKPKTAESMFGIDGSFRQLLEFD